VADDRSSRHRGKGVAAAGAATLVEHDAEQRRAEIDEPTEPRRARSWLSVHGRETSSMPSQSRASGSEQLADSSRAERSSTVSARARAASRPCAALAVRGAPRGKRPAACSAALRSRRRVPSRGRATPPLGRPANASARARARMCCDQPVPPPARASPNRADCPPPRRRGRHGSARRVVHRQRSPWRG
jgi:hypothetical protein